MIEQTHDPDLRLTTFVCKGTVSPDEVETVIRAFYEGSPTLNTLWDYTQGDVSALTGDAMGDLAKFINTTSHSREGGRTALVFPMEQLMNMKDQLAGLAEVKVAQAQIKIFQDLDHAIEWIKGTGS